jgi:hypothetical protein
VETASDSIDKHSWGSRAWLHICGVDGLD